MKALVSKWIYRILLVASLMGVMLALTTDQLSASFWNQVINGKISIVWMHDGHGRPTSIAQSRMVNIAIWPTNQVSCSSNTSMSLLIARNNEPTVVSEKLGLQVLHLGTLGRFPTIEFNDIPADMASNPSAQYRFITYAPTTETSSGFSGNVWVHAIDARTIYPAPLASTGMSAQTLPSRGIDTRIQVVWAHDAAGNAAPVERATYVNITVEAFEHGTLNAIPTNALGKYDYTLALWAAEGNNMIQPAHSSSVVATPYIANGKTYTRWTFNDVPVTPGRQYNFMVGASAIGKPGMYPYASIWTHASDARTMMPSPQEPLACSQP